MVEITLPEARKTVFVVGLGMVGIAFIEKLLNLDTQMRYRIVTCGEEMHLAYNRVALTDYFQHRNVEKLYLNQADWYAAQDPTRFQFFVGEAVTAIDTNAHTVSTDKGRVVKYDYCVLATGSEATLPSFASPHVQGVFVYRNIADLNNLLAYSQTEGVKGEPSVVVGGGLLGLEAAKALYDLEDVGAVTIVHRQAYPLSRQLDAAGGEIVLRRIEALGVRVLGQVSPSRLVTELQDGAETLIGVELPTGEVVPCRIAVFSVGIRPRDELAISAGIQCEGNNAGGRGITVDDLLQTSAPDLFAIGECASWKGQTYGLIAPGIEMADILSFNLTQTQTDVGGFTPRKMNTPDLSTKLKLVGVDVASFGDYFVDKSRPRSLPSKPFAPNNATPTSSSPDVQDPNSSQSSQLNGNIPSNGKPEVSNKVDGLERKRADASSPRKRHGQAAAAEGPIETLTYRDPFAGVYKKYIFSTDGKYILGGMMVGDTNDYVKLLALVKKKKPLDVPPSQFIAGSSSGDDSGADLDDDTQICSCHNVTKGDVAKCVKDGADTLGAVKSKTKAGTGCGGCLPLVTNIFRAEMKKAGNEVSNNLCPHFAMTRAELFSIAKIKKLKSFTEIMSAVGVHKDAVGCETCKPAIGSILASLWNEHIMNPVHHANQDTNDRFLANIQRNGTFSVIPRIPAGEITPDKLLALAQVAKKYGLYTKITGGQRIDLFGAQKADLPAIWKELGEAGFESGHAYGKALRTVKSCVGTSWCRYGVGDSVGLAIALEERYKGIRAPHKFKGGVSGCVRECAEAQSKDFGLIATDKGWNIFIGGNGGANPRHATLFATDVPPSHAVKIMDRFLMYYIRTADKLMRTARWIEQMDGGIERLKKILLDDKLGICEDLEKDMDELVGTYVDEWKVVVQDPERQKQFRQFANTDERVAPVEPIPERGQQRPADWPKTSPAVHLRTEDLAASKEEWAWRPLARVSDLTPTDAGTTSAAVKYGETQLAIFHVPRRGYFATQQMCPHKRAFVLEHGIVGDDPTTGALYVSCPMHKRNFSLTTGTCINDDSYSIIAFDVRVDPPSLPSSSSSSPEDSTLSVFLPPPPALDAVLATGKWMVRRDTARTLDGPSPSTTDGVPKSAGDGVVPKSVLTSGVPYSFPVSSVDGAGGCAATGCGDSKLDW